MFKMDNTKEKEYVNQPLIIDGTNYDYWKACMIALLKSMDSKTWKEIINGWGPPKVTTQDGPETLIPEKNWSKEEDEEAHGNSRSLNAIYNGVEKYVFRPINT